MVYSRMDGLFRYLKPEAFAHVREFLRLVEADMREGEYPIWGREIFGRVMRYATKKPGECRIEAHDRYVDIQSSIVGAEGISVFDRRELGEGNAEGEDVVFFAGENARRVAYTVNLPGYFTLLLPGDAHRPQEDVEGFGEVKKLVVKVAVSQVLGG